MLRVSLAVALALMACHKDKEAALPPPGPATPITLGTVGPDGVRRVEVNASTAGYKPDRIGGKPGEKLVLVFTRTADSTCIAEVKTPEGKVVPLPKGTPVEVALTVPASGELAFTCGMDMYRGAIVAARP